MHEHAESRRSAQPTLPAYELQRRPLTRVEAELVVAQIRRSPKITGYSLAEWTGDRDTFVLVRPESGELLGALLVHHLLQGWSEIAVVFVLEQYRGQGYGRAMLRGALRTLEHSGRRQLLFFSDDLMERMAQEAGFEVHTDVDALVSRRPGYRGFLKLVYPVQWMANAYRIRELRRKRRELACSFEFKIALKESEGTSA